MSIWHKKEAFIESLFFYLNTFSDLIMLQPQQELPIHNSCLYDLS